VLSELRPLEVSSEEELLAALVPHRDGVVLSALGRRATFLPKVWEHVPSPRRFLDELKGKAGLRRDFWAPNVAIWTYTTDIATGSVRDYRARSGLSQRVAATIAGVDDERTVDDL
jgi:AMMECR1 domain-containing protein